MVIFVPINHHTFIIITQDFKRKLQSKPSMYLQLLGIKPISMGFFVFWVIIFLVKTNQIVLICVGNLSNTLLILERDKAKKG